MKRARMLGVLLFLTTLQTASAFYDPAPQRWINRDPIGEIGWICRVQQTATTAKGMEIDQYVFVNNNPVWRYDLWGLWETDDHGRYRGEDYGWTCPWNPFSTWRHFRDIGPIRADLDEDIKKCNKDAFLSHMHQMQDYFSHYKQGYRWWLFGHCWCSHPDKPEKHPEEYREMLKMTALYEVAWQQKCGDLPGTPDGT